MDMELWRERLERARSAWEEEDLDGLRAIFRAAGKDLDELMEDLFREALADGRGD